MNLDVYGLGFQRGMPLLWMLSKMFNRENRNHIEIARDFFHEYANKGQVFDAIVIVINNQSQTVFVFK